MNLNIYLIGVVSDFDGIRYFQTNNDELDIGSKVIIEADYGLVLGTINYKQKFKPAQIVNDEPSIYPAIIRQANNDDLKNYQKQIQLALKDKVRIQAESDKLNLNMRLVSCHYTIDYSKLLIVYTADDKVDFRELLKVLKTIYNFKIELRQIGARDKAKLKGGLGICGLPICCSNFLKVFDGITINLARNQNLSLNNSKITGQCGKFICCLKYEDELYNELKKGYPIFNEEINRNNQNYKVTSINYLSNKIVVQIDNTDYKTLSLEEYNTLKYSHSDDITKVELSQRLFNKSSQEKTVINNNNRFESKYIKEPTQTEEPAKQDEQYNNFKQKNNNKNTDYKKHDYNRNNHSNNKQSKNATRPSFFDRFKKKDNDKQGYLGNIYENNKNDKK